MIDTTSVAKKTLRLSVFTDEQVVEIYRASIEILQKTGIKVGSQKARKLLKSAGASIIDDIVKVPEFIVEECLQKAPKGFILYDRLGQRAMEVETRKVFFGTSCASPRTMDCFTGEVRPTEIADIRNAAIIGDALQNIDYQMPMGAAQDVPSFASDLYEFEALVSNTTKPLVCFCLSTRAYEYLYEMAAAVAGGIDAFSQRPFLIGYPENITPLVYPEATCDKLLLGAKLNVPQVCIPAGQAGAVSPMTLAGTLALVLAESLMGLVMVQLQRPGAPYILGAFTAVMDMRTANISWGAPEFSLMTSGFCDIARYFRLPTWGTAGCTDAKELDAQAGAEAAFSLLGQALGGANIIHDVGDMDQGMISAPDMLVLGDEIIGMVRRFISGIDVNADSIAREVISQIGPGGNFLVHEHTLRHCRTEHWIPNIMVRESYESWRNAGKRSVSGRIRDRIRNILDTHQVKPLSNSIIGELDRIKRQGTEELGADS